MRYGTRHGGSWPRVGVLALLILVAFSGLAAFAQSGRGQSSWFVSSGSPAGTISTVIGGVGGPAKATTVAMGFESSFTGPCGVAYGDGHLYIAAGPAVRQVDPATD